MNANAYGGQLAEVLEWVEVCTPTGSRPARSRARSASPTAAPTSARTRSSPAPASPSPPPTPSEVKATMASMRERRHEAQPSGIKTFGSTFKNPEDERAERPHRRPAAGGGRLPGPAGRRRPLLARARQLRRERRRGDHRRRARADGRGPAAGCTSASASSWSPRCRRWARCAGRRAGSCEPEAAQAGVSAKRRPWGRWAALGLLAVLAVGLVYWLALRGTTRRAAPRRRRGRRRRSAAAPKRSRSAPTAQVLAWLPLPTEAKLPQLPLSEAPKGGRLAGPALEQARVLGAAPATLRPYLAEQLLRRKRGRRRNCARGSNCASAMQATLRRSGGRPPRSSPTPR